MSLYVRCECMSMYIRYFPASGVWQQSRGSRWEEQRSLCEPAVSRDQGMDMCSAVLVLFHGVRHRSAIF
jgi:hypothetical protein